MALLLITFNDLEKVKVKFAVLNLFNSRTLWNVAQIY